MAAGAGRGERLQESHRALAVKDAFCVESGDAGDGDCALGGVEIDYFLGGGFECWKGTLDLVCLE